MSKEILTAIDVGTTKICCLVGAVVHDSLGQLGLRMLGSSITPSRGIRRGVVMDVPEVTSAIGQVLEGAEKAAGLRITSAYVGIAGSHITTTNSTSMKGIRLISGSVLALRWERFLKFMNAGVLIASSNYFVKFTKWRASRSAANSRVSK